MEADEVVQALVAHDRKEEEEKDDERRELAAVIDLDKATCTYNII